MITTTANDLQRSKHKVMLNSPDRYPATQSILLLRTAAVDKRVVRKTLVVKGELVEIAPRRLAPHVLDQRVLAQLLQRNSIGYQLPVGEGKRAAM